MNRKYYHFDTRFISLRDELRSFLESNNIYFELSGNYSYYHFEVLLNPSEKELVNQFLDEHTISECG